jgi:hypothetical protein
LRQRCKVCKHSPKGYVINGTNNLSAKSAKSLSFNPKQIVHHKQSHF